MKILFTGSGAGGHFYPIIAIAEALNRIVAAEKLLPPKLYYMAPEPGDQRVLFEQGITYLPASAGRVRRYFSVMNAFDLVKTSLGVLKAVLRLFSLYPDVVFGKGAYGSFPALFAARILGIPVVIHESDSEPGRVNRWAGKFAKRVAISYPDAARFFDKEKVALTGNPIRKDIATPAYEGGREFLKLEEGTPVLLILGGSSGSQAINEAVLDALPRLLNKYQVIHQVGEKNFEEVGQIAAGSLHDHPHKDRYRPYAFLNVLALRMAAGVCSLVISRAGSTLFEIAAWGKPSIVIPIPESISHDQTKNAFSYGRSGAATIIEQRNLTPVILESEIERILGDAPKAAAMSAAASKFAKKDAAETIAREILNIALAHER
ncbi:UDP-N-acetylglucosamine--N-acetylmuramyl-(pentapeptide) pyrophosphoryl-undecaprenol N-acetylglucosamine transferase [Candidatus Parcubacteria bacterium]|nr:UDP-N-acetylglucosamine--N-acetylmuramyl-(pentapeptide) pyrophosphoryl-undecaprenol N-acetylglucosamine transferase [Candidatus Parcubacteria bacterium]